MKEKVNAPNCGRESELIALLYGELDREEEKTFNRHVLECAACRTEIEGLRDVRESVVMWRNESLGGVTSPSGVANSSAAVVDQRRPSALAALRQFFYLSPLWLKGAVVFASLLFCLFAGLAVARLREKPSAPLAASPNSNQYSERDIKAMVDRRVQDELQRIKNSPERAATAPLIVSSVPRHIPGGRSLKRSTEVAGGPQFQKARRPLTKAEREQLAADLRLVSAKGEGELDLLGDRINQ
jgi:anti-sigma factor RsiW